MSLSDLHNPAAAARSIREFQKRFSTKVCLAPTTDCQGSIISAHTLSVALMLRPLSRNGMVYSIKHDFHHSNHEEPCSIALKGINETSTFNGFCAKHDKLLFAPVEDNSFFCTKEQLFTFAYRAVAKEAYLKRRQAESILTPDIVKEIHGIDSDLIFSEKLLLHQAASLRGAEEIERLKSRLDTNMIKRDFGRIISTVFEFGRPIPIAASFVYAPDFDFFGNYLQDFDDFDNDLSHIMATILPTSTGGFVILSYEDTSNTAPQKLIDSIRAQDDISSSVFWLSVCQTENFAYAPKWFESLPFSARKKILKTFVSNADYLDSKINLLKNRDLTISDWKTLHSFTI